MKNLLLLPLGVMLILSLGYGKTFDCGVEYCLENGTTELWSCYYLNCANKPDWNVNVTWYNTTTYNVVNCSEEMLYDDLAEMFNMQFVRFDNRINYTSWVSEESDELRGIRANLSLCELRADIYKKNSVNTSDFTVCGLNLENSQNEYSNLLTSYRELEDKDSQMGTGILIGIGLSSLAFYVWYNQKDKKPGPKAESFSTGGARAVNTDKTEERIENIRIRADMKDLKAQLRALSPLKEKLLNHVKPKTKGD